MSKIAIVAIAIAMASTAQAQVFSMSEADYCQALARYASAVAEERESGRSLESQYQDIASVDMDDAKTWDLRFIAETVYSFPRLVPSEEGNVIYRLCSGE